MKVSISFLPEEQERAEALCKLLMDCFPSAKLRRSERHPPFKHLYLTTKKPETPRE